MNQEPKVIGIAGGGQLGRMLTDAAHAHGFEVIVLDPTPRSPAGQVADFQIVGDFKDYAAILGLADKCDFLTYEIETVNTQALQELKDQGFPVHPTPHTLAVIKDKLSQKRFLESHGIPVAPFVAVDSEEAVGGAGNKFGYPFILKARSGGYDGRGNATVELERDIPKAREKLKGQELYAEQFISFEKELAVVAARTVEGEVAIYPLVETIHKNHICHMVLAPAPVSKSITEKAHGLAEKVLKAFDGAGVFSIEMFLTKEGNVLVNEVAPRVHNSGHFATEACATSQFEQHIRAITGMSLGSTAMKVPAAVMVNILGARRGPAEPRGIKEAEKIPGVKVHIYGKVETRPKRKMGHLTAIASALEEAREKAEKAHLMISI